MGELPSNLGQIIGQLMLAAAGERLAPVSARARDLDREARRLEAQRRAEDLARRQQAARDAAARVEAEARAEAVRRAEAKAAAARARGPSQRGAPRSDGGRVPVRRLQLLRALRGRWLTLAEIFEAVGGNREALRIYIVTLRHRGWVRVRGEKGSYRYTATAEGQASIDAWEGR